MNTQQKIAFIIGILSLILLDICFVRGLFGFNSIFEDSFFLSEFFRVDYWYHLGLLGVFATFILLMNGHKSYESIDAKLERIEIKLGVKE